MPVFDLRQQSVTIATSLKRLWKSRIDHVHQQM